MLAPSTLHQLDARTRTAKRKPQSTFGALTTVLAGEFLQLPHPTQSSLALPIDDVTGKYNTAKSSTGADEADAHHESDDEENEEATSEHRSGYEL